MSKWRVIFCGVLLSMGLVSMAQASLGDSLTVEDLKENGVLFTPHNRVTLLPSGAEKFEDMFKAIEQARNISISVVILSEKRCLPYWIKKYAKGLRSG